MSKPREFMFSEELEDWGVDEYMRNDFMGPWYQVVPKADADKLAKAVEREIKILEAAGAKGSALGLKIALKDYGGWKCESPTRP